MIRTTSLVLVALLLVSTGTGCARRLLTSHPGDSVHLRLKPRNHEVLGPVKGKDCVTRVLVFQFTSPDLLEAEVVALEAKPGAQILLNKHVYQELRNYILFGKSCFYVEGLAARLK